MATSSLESNRYSLADFDFVLPAECIAQYPARPRDSAKLLAVGDQLRDLHVSDLPSLLRPGDLLVANDTKVIPGQLTARRGQARVGVTLDQPRADGSWHALARNARRIKPGDELVFSDELAALVTENDAQGGIVLRFNLEHEVFWDALHRAGALALPPYIDRPAGPTAADQSDYQTIFASNRGAVAAPTAGLHFTPGLLAALERNGIERTQVTLHVGAGTFLPVRSDDVSSHRMHAEHGVISAEVATKINATKARGGQVIAVGTTSLRLLESAAAPDGSVHPFNGDTSLFILPGHKFHVVDLLMTNFHLPKSTLFMLVSAFAGVTKMRTAYEHAVSNGYRFYSYGDSSLLERVGP